MWIWTQYCQIGQTNGAHAIHYDINGMQINGIGLVRRVKKLVAACHNQTTVASGMLKIERMRTKPRNESTKCSS